MNGDILYVREKQHKTAAVAYHGNGMYRPGKSGGDSENTPDTKPVEWAATGRKWRLRQVQNQK